MKPTCWRNTHSNWLTLKPAWQNSSPEAAVLRKRRMIYYPIASVIGFVLLFALYGFVNGEQTAITTVPAQLATVQVYVPQTPTPLPPTPTLAPSPTAAPTTVAPATAASTGGASAAVPWVEVSPIFTTKCGMCHSATLATNGLNLSTYADAMKGAADGPVIVPNDAAKSKLMAIQSAGGHPGQLSVEELALVRAWIEAGAIDK